MINNNKFDGKIHNVMCMMLKKTRNKTLETTTVKESLKKNYL